MRIPRPSTGMVAPLWEEIADGDLDGREGKRRHELGWRENRDVAVSPSIDRRDVRCRIAVDLEHAIDEIHDPVLCKPGSRIEAALALSVEGHARFRDLDGQCRTRRVGVSIIPGPF